MVAPTQNAAHKLPHMLIPCCAARTKKLECPMPLPRRRGVNASRKLRKQAIEDDLQSMTTAGAGLPCNAIGVMDDSRQMCQSASEGRENLTKKHRFLLASALTTWQKRNADQFIEDMAEQEDQHEQLEVSPDVEPQSTDSLRARMGSKCRDRSCTTHLFSHETDSLGAKQGADRGGCFILSQPADPLRARMGSNCGERSSTTHIFSRETDSVETGQETNCGDCCSTSPILSQPADSHRARRMPSFGGCFAMIDRIVFKLKSFVPLANASKHAKKTLASGKNKVVRFVSPAKLGEKQRTSGKSYRARRRRA